MHTTPEPTHGDQWRSPKQARHEAHQALAKARNAHLASDFEDWDDEFIDSVECVSGRSMRSRHHTHVVNHEKGKTELTAHNHPKVWKMPFWKRRFTH